MKKVSSLLVTLVVMVATGAAGYGQNLLLNPSIESGSSTTQIDDWTAHSGDTYRETVGAYGFTTAAMHDGSYGLKEFGGDGDLFQANISVQSGVTYTASGWFYHSSTQDAIAVDASSTRMFIHIEWFDSSNNSLRNDYSANHNGTSPADSWNLISLEVAAPVGADHATFHIETDANVGGGSVFGDDFAFQAVPEPSSFVLVAGALAGLGLMQRTKRTTGV